MRFRLILPFFLSFSLLASPAFAGKKKTGAGDFVTTIKNASAYLASGAGSYKVAAEAYANPQGVTNGTMAFGISTGNSGPNPTNLTGFFCDPDQRSGSLHWWFSGTGAGIDTGINCNQVWHQLEISVSGLTATGYIDGSSIGSDSINAGNYLIFSSAWSHSLGAASAQIYLDWIAVNENVPSTLN